MVMDQCLLGECVHACGVCVCKLITAGKEENWNSIAKCEHKSIHKHTYTLWKYTISYDSVLVFSADLGVPAPW